MIGTLVLADVVTSPDYHIAWFCREATSRQEFTLLYQQRGDKIWDVKVIVPHTPRLASDDRTKWQATISGDAVSFKLFDKSLGDSGTMELAAGPTRTGRRELRWKEIIGIGSHIPMENAEEVAVCTTNVSERG
jgi:hypothetical protein